MDVAAQRERELRETGGGSFLLRVHVPSGFERQTAVTLVEERIVECSAARIMKCS